MVQIYESAPGSPITHVPDSLSAHGYHVVNISGICLTFNQHSFLFLIKTFAPVFFRFYYDQIYLLHHRPYQLGDLKQITKGLLKHLFGYII